MPYWSTWNEYVCGNPKCKAHFFISVGDIQDVTGCDPEFVECPSCGKVEPADPESHAMPEDDDDISVDKGVLFERKP